MTITETDFLDDDAPPQISKRFFAGDGASVQTVVGEARVIARVCEVVEGVNVSNYGLVWRRRLGGLRGLTLGRRAA